MAFIYDVNWDRPRKPRKYRTHLTLDNIDLDDDEFVNRYRLPRPMVEDLAQEFMELNPIYREDAIRGDTEVLAGLHYYASGSFFREVSTIHGISIPSTSRAVDHVSDFLGAKAPQHIRFPRRNEWPTIAAAFHQYGGMPRVIGCIDGTLIRIKAPSRDEFAYVDRHQDHSIVVQAVCGQDLRFTNICAKFPGSNHDSFVFDNSGMGAEVDGGRLGNYILLGDSGYRTRPNLMTPFLRPRTPAQERYNVAHKRTRCTVERAFGVLKSRFRVLDKTGGIMQKEPTSAAKVITACCVLHNMCIEAGLPEPEALAPPDEDDLPPVNPRRDGLAARHDLVALLFNRR